MDINQFAVYQLKNGPETRQMRFRSYEKLQQSGIQVRYEYYREVYLGKMQRQDTPENIRERLQKKIPKSFDGHSLSVSDVLVLNREGEITAYYVEKEGFTVIAGFIRIGSSGALLTFETTNFHIEGKAGSWLVLDTLIIDGREFFLMEHMEYGRNAAYVILDAEGKIVAEDNRNGFDENAKQQIREYLHPPKPVQKPATPSKREVDNKVAGLFDRKKPAGSESGTGKSDAGSGVADKGKAGSSAGWSLDGRSIVGNGGRPVMPTRVPDIRGTVVVEITVNATGKVTNAEVRLRGTNGVDSKLRSAALQAARKTRFNAVGGVPDQKGTITYHFDVKG